MGGKKSTPAPVKAPEPIQYAVFQSKDPRESLPPPKPVAPVEAKPEDENAKLGNYQTPAVSTTNGNAIMTG